MPMLRWEGSAIKDHATADPLIPRHARGTRPASAGGFSAAAGRRFSPLTAEQRAAVDAFTTQARGWALRQARRTYRHLPAELHEQAVDRAVADLREGAAVTDRRALYQALADGLDDALRRVHSGWCLNQSRALLGDSPSRTAPGGADTQAKPLTDFIADGLGGLERAVLQLEIGAGRDTSVVRAALKLGPRQYARHRDHGLSKLRGAIAGQISGRVCEHHLESVTLAATGDRTAGDRLSAGADRCRSCAREATAVRRVLNERLALAPWPLAIKPVGIFAAKLGGLGALLSGSKGGGSATLLTGAASSGGAQALATILAATVVASGTVAVTSSENGVDRTSARVTDKAAEADAKTTTAARDARSTRSERRSSAIGGTRAVVRRKRTSGGSRTTNSAGTAASAQQQPAAQPSATVAVPDVGLTGLSKVTKPVTGAVDGVAKKLPKKIKASMTGSELDLPDVGIPVDKLTDRVDSLLAP